YIIFLIIIFALTGCGYNQKPDVDLATHQEEINLDNFFDLKECIVEYDFIIEKEYDDFSLNAEGKYDLNEDSKVDLIEIKLLGREESTIRINDSEVSIYTDHPFDVYLVDFLKDDGFIELALYDDGPSADPVTTFYRYDGKNISELGALYTDIKMGDPNKVLIDGGGSFIEIGGLAKFISPQIIKGFYTLEDNQFIYNPLDYSKYINREYTITTGFKAFFVEENLRNDLTSQDIEFIWDQEVMREFNKGDTIKLIVHDEFWYGIELQDGTTGILYFWIGD
ncbi:MAG: hypothetical protein GX021_03670, partial [Tissierellia bacterium]|nr:hypothetical protein [Tissierellia bacterium]